MAAAIETYTIQEHASTSSNGFDIDIFQLQNTSTTRSCIIMFGRKDEKLEVNVKFADAPAGIPWHVHRAITCTSHIDLILRRNNTEVTIRIVKTNETVFESIKSLFDEFDSCYLAPQREQRGPPQGGPPPEQLRF